MSYLFCRYNRCINKCTTSSTFPTILHKFNKTKELITLQILFRLFDEQNRKNILLDTRFLI